MNDLGVAQNGEDAPRLPEGSVIADRYELRGVLGRGGTGTVYDAVDRIRGDEVALKVLHIELASEPLVVARMMREAELLQRLGIGHVLEFGQTRIGPSSDVEQVYIVMPKLSGAPLSTLLEAGPIAEARAVAIARGLCDELARAHSHGIVHRDVKPDNVIVCSDESVRLIDFGIAKRQGAPQQANVTEHGVVFGSPEYMAPEQAEGLKLDGRSDIYATGVVLFEMLSGERPFVGSAEQVMRDKVMRSAPSLPEVTSLALRRVVSHALATQPSDRYRSAAAMSWALERATLHPMDEDDVSPSRASDATSDGYGTQRSVRVGRDSVDVSRPTEVGRPKVVAEKPARSVPRVAVLPWWGWTIAGIVGALFGAWLAWRR